MSEQSLFDSREYVPTVEVTDAKEAEKLPEFKKQQIVQLAISFDTDEDRERFIQLLGLRPKRTGRQWPAYYPPEDEPNAQFELI